MGYPDGTAQRGAARQLERVERHYAALFESSIDLGGGRALVFTGTEDDPETLATLAEMGFAKPRRSPPGSAPGITATCGRPGMPGRASF